MSSKRAIELLTEIGWHPQFLAKNDNNKASAVREFQRGFGFGLLVSDGDPGPLTISAMEYSVANEGRCTPNFKYSEFKSRYGIIRLHSSLPRGLELLRSINGGAINVINGYRDPRHNREVGGASQSVHLSGAASDATLPHIKQVMALGVFSGIGTTLADGIVRHVDMRNVDNQSLRNGGSPRTPALWGYKQAGGTTNAPARWKAYQTNGAGLPPLLTWKGEPGAKPKKLPAGAPTAKVPSGTAAQVPAAKPRDPRAVEIQSIEKRILEIEKATASVSARVSRLES